MEDFHKRQLGRLQQSNDNLKEQIRQEKHKVTQLISESVDEEKDV